MLLLSNLSEEGFLQLKKDREAIMEKIRELNRILNQFDLALPSLESIYDPYIEIYEMESEYWGKITINHPDLDEARIIDFQIGEIKSLNNSELLHKESKLKAREEIKRIFPLYFL
jgi:hypothetical protein